MARAQFQKGQKVWVGCVGAWATIEKVQPVWAKGFDEPVRVTYDVGLGREFAAAELMMAAADAAGAEVGDWRGLPPAAPRRRRLAETRRALGAERPDAAPPAVLALARQARDTLQPVTEIL